MKMRIICGIMGVDKCEADLNPEEKRIIKMLEHCRGNAYMRSEGRATADQLIKEREAIWKTA